MCPSEYKVILIRTRCLVLCQSINVVAHTQTCTPLSFRRYSRIDLIVRLEIETLTQVLSFLVFLGLHIAALLVGRVCLVAVAFLLERENCLVEVGAHV